MMWFAVIVCIGLVTVTYGGVVYSPSYANVRYEGNSEDNSESDSQDTKEEVTVRPTFCLVNPSDDTDTATEPLSETVNATKVYTNNGPKKLHERIELSEELEPTQEPDLEPVDPPVQEQQGIYYIYHPNGLLQRIIFAARDDLGNPKYQTKPEVEPLAEPIYTYDQNTLVFQTLQ